MNAFVGHTLYSYCICFHHTSSNLRLSVSWFSTLVQKYLNNYWIISFKLNTRKYWNMLQNNNISVSPAWTPTNYCCHILWHLWLTNKLSVSCDCSYSHVGDRDCKAKVNFIHPFPVTTYLYQGRDGNASMIIMQAKPLHGPVSCATFCSCTEERSNRSHLIHYNSINLYRHWSFKPHKSQTVATTSVSKLCSGRVSFGNTSIDVVCICSTFSKCCCWW